MDVGGDWCLEQASHEYLQKALQRLAVLETMTWTAILADGKHYHYVEVSRLPSKAKRRLQDIERDDLDQIVSLRVEGQPRVWGVRDRGVLHILWWDPEHTVYPSQKKHT
jgi:hypothetical protein